MMKKALTAVALFSASTSFALDIEYFQGKYEVAGNCDWNGAERVYIQRGSMKFMDKMVDSILIRIYGSDDAAVINLPIHSASGTGKDIGSTNPNARTEWTAFISSETDPRTDLRDDRKKVYSANNTTYILQGRKRTSLERVQYELRKDMVKGTLVYSSGPAASPGGGGGSSERPETCELRQILDRENDTGPVSSRTRSRD